MQGVKDATANVQEKTGNVAAKAGEKWDETKASAHEKVEKTTAHDPADKHEAEEKKHLKQAEAAGHLNEKQAENIAKVEEKKHGIGHAAHDPHTTGSAATTTAPY